MRRLLILLLALLTVFVVLRVGWLLPHRYIESGLDGYSGLKKEYASTAIELARLQMREWGSLLSPPVAAYQVTRVKRCPGPLEGPPFAVDVRLYTFFGLPAGNADLPCDS